MAPGAAADGRGDATDAVGVRRTLPDRSTTLLRAMDRGPEMVGDAWFFDLPVVDSPRTRFNKI